MRRTRRILFLHVSSESIFLQLESLTKFGDVAPAIGVIEKELRPFSLTSPYIAPPGVVTDQLWRDLVNSECQLAIPIR